MMLLAINSSPKLSSKISVEKRISSVVTGRQGAARAAGGTGGQGTAAEGDSALGGEHATRHARDVLLDRRPRTCMIVLASVAPTT